MARGSITIPLPMAPGGLRQDVNETGLPPGTWLAAQNFLNRQGFGRPRPGTATLYTSALTDRITGFGVRGEVGIERNLVTHSLTAAESWDGTTTAAITGTWAATTDNDRLARMVPFNSGGTLYLARTNLDNAVSKWSGTGSFTAISGAPQCRDLMVLGRRVVGVNVVNASGTFVDGVQWSGFNDIDTWSVTAFTQLDETPGACIACASFGPLAGAIYKTSAVYLASQQAAINPFQLQLVRRVPGPVGTACLIPYLGNHYWLGADGAVYVFDGATVEVVSRGLVSTLAEHLNAPNAPQTFGLALALNEPELWWVYPDAETGVQDQAICLNLATGAITPHDLTHEYTAGIQYIHRADVTYDELPGTIDDLDALYPTIDSMGARSEATAVLGGSAGEVDQFGVATQDRGGTDIAWTVTLPWQRPNPQGDSYMDGVATYWAKEASSVPITITLTPTKSLGGADTGKSKIIDLEHDEEHFVAFPDMRARWAKITLAGDSATATMKSHLVELYAWPRGTRVTTVP